MRQRTYAVVDSGTSRTRLRLWHEGALAWSGSAEAGARDTAIDGHPGKIRDAIKTLLRNAGEASGLSPKAIICSGMITSNMGLYEVPHLRAPAGVDDLARAVTEMGFPDISEVHFSFIPGVKSPLRDALLTTLDDGDVLRGEEAEIAGLRARLNIGGPATFLHIGSHHKAIDVDASGRILRSRSAITGELLAAVVGHTILKSSTSALEGLPADADAVLAGATAAEQHGLGRALFLVRVGEQLAHFSRERMTSYLLGALAALDLPLLEGRAPKDPVIVYGQGAFPAILEALLRRRGFERVQVVDEEAANEAALEGAVHIFERSRAMRSEG